MTLYFYWITFKRRGRGGRGSDPQRTKIVISLGTNVQLITNKSSLHNVRKSIKEQSSICTMQESWKGPFCTCSPNSISGAGFGIHILAFGGHVPAIGDVGTQGSDGGDWQVICDKIWMWLK